MTFSLGVLQNDLIRFDPPLPEWKLNAIHGVRDTQIYDSLFQTFFLVSYFHCFQFHMSYYFHYYLLFPADQPWFISNDTNYVHYAGEVRGYYTAWLNMEVFNPGCRIIQGSATHFEAERLSQMTSNTITLYFLYL